MVCAQEKTCLVSLNKSIGLAGLVASVAVVVKRRDILALFGLAICSTVTTVVLDGFAFAF